MEIKNESRAEEELKPRAFIEFGSPGHEAEYVLTIHPNRHAMAKEIPYEWKGELEKLLGEGWSVANRGTRIEIMPPYLEEQTTETASKVRRAIKSTIGNDYELVEI